MKLTINGTEIEAARGETVLKAAKRAGVDIPHLCSLDWAPSPAASCRLCVVEVEGNPKLLTSCTLEPTEGMAVHTHTPRVLKARRAIMELLIASHPQECLSCVRSGDCELATLAGELGVRRDRYVGVRQAAPGGHQLPGAVARPQQVRALRPLRHRVPRRAGRRRDRLRRPGVQDQGGPRLRRRAQPEPVCVLRPVRACVPHRGDRGARPGRRRRRGPGRPGRRRRRAGRAGRAGDSARGPQQERGRARDARAACRQRSRRSASTPSSTPASPPTSP